MQEEDSRRALLLQIDSLRATYYRRCVSALLPVHSVSLRRQLSRHRQCGIVVVPVAKPGGERVGLDQECHSLSLRDSCRDESAERERDRLASRADHLAEKAVVVVLELEPTIIGGEAAISAEV